MENLTSNQRVQDALIQHVTEHQFATAYRAVRILGRKACTNAIPAIRNAIASDDYLLQAYSASALAELRDYDGRNLIENLLVKTENTLVMVHCIGALKSLAQEESLDVLMSVLKRPQVSTHMRDEVVFGLSGTLGMESWLYPKYIAFLEDHDVGVALLLDELDAAGFSIADVEETQASLASGTSALGGFLVRVHRLVRDIVDTECYFAKEVKPVVRGLEELGLIQPVTGKALLAAWENKQIQSFIRFRFFLGALAVYSVCRSNPASRDSGQTELTPAIS